MLYRRNLSPMQKRKRPALGRIWMTITHRFGWPAAAAIAAAALLAACGGGSNARTLAGQVALRGTSEIGVNSFLWRASLDTLSFMPLASADPYGGVIITDWYSNPAIPSERFKATVYILDSRLRADALNVAINKQRLGVNGWTEDQLSPDTALQIENAILTRARQIKLDTVG